MLLPQNIAFLRDYLFILLKFACSEEFSGFFLFEKSIFSRFPLVLAVIMYRANFVLKESANSLKHMYLISIVSFFPL